ncbi:DUF5666 domain-containing protein [Brumicola nitratireducens]|uniref:DUF5666 domain-containing protein n=1 Tax=Glaciecola nitratireducens (strain JCM 12485 / KCTC 12276 / FR1064) TaxID=1085623 RepID=G4QDT9_GLANF|nr:DUF5666 domain-containing protein [Glaciecola nitratireducens]AEP31118.1 hypothetical protein GNIT_3022 [Glaciecola nitratireducens FR1064]
MEIQKKHIFGTMVVTSMLYACGGGSDTAVDPIAPISANGALQLSIKGLPSGADSTVLVTGPEGYTSDVNGDATLSDLLPGTYTVTADPVVAQNAEFDVIPASISFTVTANNTTVQELIYMTDIQSKGVITNFGSVYVNGVRFSTDDTTISTDDNDDASEDDLDVGMNVTVKGRKTADGSISTASHIDYNVHAEGPIESISLSDNQIVVLGQVYQVDSRTVFEDKLFSELKVADVVEISAIKSADETWLATHIETSDAADTYKLIGEIANLDESGQTFNVGSVSVDFSQAVIEGTLANGALVKISSAQGLVDGVIVADEVELKDDNSNSDKLALDGIISSLSETQFVIAGKTVQWDENTQFRAGNSDDLNVGIRVKIEGTELDGNLVASVIRFDKQGEIEVKGVIQAIDLESNTLTVLDTVFLVDEYSQLKDDSDLDIRRFRLDLLSIGDLVEIEAFSNGDNLIVKTLEREETDASRNNDDAEAEIKGQVIAIDGQTIELQGAIVTTGQFTEYELGDSDVSADVFFAQLLAGDWIEVEGIKQADGSILATDIETSRANGDNGDDESGGVEFSGLISSFDSVESFTVNGRLITTDERTVFKGTAFTTIAEGVRVEVYGREADNGDILATRIKMEDNDHSDDYSVEIEGALEADAENGRLIINQQTVFFDVSTQISDGSEADLLQGTYVEIKASVDENGTLFALKIEIEDGDEQNSADVEGTISELLDNGEIVVEGITIVLNEMTEFENGNISRIEVGAYVEVEGQFNEQQKLVARKIEFSDSDESEIEGRISAVLSETQFTLGDIVIEHNQYTAFEYGSASDISVGVEVEVDGFVNDEGIFIAEKIEFQED